MTLPEYVQYGIYDPALRDEERRRFITNTLHWPITHQCCDMTWQSTTEDCWLCARILEDSGIVMPRTLAVVDRTERAYPGAQCIRTPADLRDFALAHVRDGAAVFGKENRGVSGFGTLLMLEAEKERLHLEGEGWFSYEDCLGRLIGDAAYILQPFERNHAFFERYTGYLATVRLCLLLAREKIEIPFAILKLPSAGHNSDHFWRKGNVACDVAPESGVILRARTKDPLGTVDYADHPDTGAPLVGETLPRWDDILGLAHACAQIFAPVRYQSMDLALTPRRPDADRDQYGRRIRSSATGKRSRLPDRRGAGVLPGVRRPAPRSALTRSPARRTRPDRNRGSLTAPPRPHHPAYGSVHDGSTDSSCGMVCERDEAEAGEEGVGQRVGERGTVAEPPWAVGTVGGLSRQVFAHAEVAQRREAGASALPLPPDDGAEPSSGHRSRRCSFTLRRHPPA